MAAGWPTLAVVFLLACLLLPTGGGGVQPRDDDGQQLQQQPSCCRKEECKCEEDYQNRFTVKCAFSGEKNVVWEPDKNPNKLAVLELNGDDRCNLTINNKALAGFAELRSFNVTGFNRVTIRSQGMLPKNARTNFTVSISRVSQLYLDTNAFHPYYGTVDVLVQDCGEVQLSSEVVHKLRSFVFRRIRFLNLSKNTFKNAATPGSPIKKMILEDLYADKLPSHAFYTPIDILSITNCKFVTIERKAFPINSIGNVTLTNVTVNLVESEAFQNSTLINNLRMNRCNIMELQNGAIMSTVQSIVIEQSKFDLVRTSAVAVATNLELYGNTFQRVAGRGFVLHNANMVLVHGNTFNETEAEAFYESIASIPETRSNTRTALLVSDNRFLRCSANDKWSPVFRLQRATSETNVTGNTFFGSCGCGPWRFVAVAGGSTDNSTAVDDDDDNDDDNNGDAEFANLNYCWVNAVAAECANLTGPELDRLRIAEFAVAAGCDQDDGAVFDLCVRDLEVVVPKNMGPGHLLEDVLSPTAERGVITTVVLLVLCGFGAVCAVSAVTWLNARGYFIKLRSLLTPNEGGGSGGGGTACRTMSAHSLSRMSVHEYAELQRLKLGGGRGSDVGAVQMIVYQDKGTQTVPEELTHEMLQNLRDKLDDPDDYADARGMIEHLYDLIRVEETCCNGGGWYSTGEGGLDDMTSTVTTKAVTAGDGQPRDVKSVGTGAPSLDRLRTPRIKMAGAGKSTVAAGHHVRRPQPPPSPTPSVNSDYVDPVDLLYGGVANVRDDESYTDIYCELTDLRSNVDDRPPQQPQQQSPPPVPDKPTYV